MAPTCFFFIALTVFDLKPTQSLIHLKPYKLKWSIKLNKTPQIYISKLLTLIY